MPKTKLKKKSIRKPRQSRIMLVDGDVLVYAQCTNSNFLTEVHNEQDEWWYQLDAKAVKDEVSARIDQLEGILGCDQTIVVFGSKENFRKKLDPEYKSGRKSRKPLGYFSIIEWCQTQYECTSVPGLEADDVLGVLHTSDDFKNGRETVIVSNDKDMRTLPGLLYNPDIIDQLKPEVITPKMAAQFLACQTMMGDSSDGYKGCPGIGEKSAAVLVEPALEAAMASDCPDSYLFNNVLLPTFRKKGLSDEYALLQARLARILRSSDVEIKKDVWTPKLWAPVNAGSSSGGSRKRSRKKKS